MKKKPANGANRAGRELDPAALRSALMRRVGRRSAATVRLTLPAVPSLVPSYVTMLSTTLAALGRALDAGKQNDLREQLERAVATSWQVSPHGNIVVRLDADAAGHGTFSATVAATPSTLQAQYDEWVATREPPFFGTFPDARLMALLPSLGEPSQTRVLDVGAGTGRNALELGRQGFQVDFIEPTEPFARTVLAGAADEDLPVKRLTLDFLAPAPPGEPRYRLVLLSEVTSHFRSASELRRLCERAADVLLPGGYLLFNVFVTVDGYTPDTMARELSQAFWSTLFTPSEMAAAVAGLPLQLTSREPVGAYEKTNLPEEAWPPRTWYPEWVGGLDVFDLPEGRPPVEMTWLLYQRTLEGARAPQPPASGG